MKSHLSAAKSSVQVLSAQPSAQTDCKINTLVIFDSRVADLEVLYQALLPGTAGFTLGSEDDALVAITQLLAETGAKRLAIVAHGEPGVVQLGQYPLDVAQVQARSAILQEWCLDEVALYSCEVGADARFVAALEQAIGTAVFAASTKVGSSTQGGTWVLDVKSVDRQVNVPLLATSLTAYQGLLPNQPPTAAVLTNTKTALNENTSTVVRIKVADISITDDGLGTNNLSVIGADAASFEIVGTSLYLKAGTSLDYETKAAYNVNVVVDDPEFPAPQSLFAPSATPGGTFTDGTGAAGDYALGMEFQSAKNGQIDAIRYYKAAGETGTHVGKIWSSAGVELASVTFTNETASGWQEQKLAAPITIAAGTTYVVSVNANEFYVATPAGLASTLTNGDISAIADGSNGVLNADPTLFPNTSFNNTNYFRDIVFTPAGPTAEFTLPFSLTVNDVNEAPTAAVLTNKTAALDENTSTATRIKVADISITDDALGTNNLTVTGADAANFEIAGKSLYLKAGTSLDFETKSSYNVNVVVDDPAFPAPQSLFADASTPSGTFTDGTGAAGDYALGMEFQSAKNGQIDAIRYYKAAGETGSHVGKIWSSAGVELANVTFTNETASGWQEQKLAAPLTIVAGTTYVVSVNANEFYVATPAGLASTLTNGDISAIADGSNGVLNADPTLFPNTSFNNANYFRDIVFTPAGAAAEFTLPYTLTVNDVNEAPTAAVLTNKTTALNENTSTATRIKVADISITDDALGTNSLSVTGADAASFEIAGTSLYLKAGTSLNFEAKSSYNINVVVDDTTLGTGPEFTLPYTLTVNDVNEAPTAASLINTTTAVLEITNTSTRIKVADISITDDALGVNTLSLTGADVANFEIDGTSLYLKAGTNLNFATKPTYNVNVVVDDTTLGAGPEFTLPFSLTVNDVIETAGSTALAVVNGNYVAVNLSSNVATNLKYNGTIFGPNTFAGWSVIGVEIVGADVNAVWKDAANNFWYSNNSGTVDKAVTAAEVATYEAAFKQDFNNDGFFGPVVETAGTTKLGLDINGQYIAKNGSSTVNLKYNSANFGPNTFAGWSVVGAEIVGADVNAVWKDAANNFWYSNNSGTVDKAVTAAEVATYEAAFKQDFNNDGFFGPVVETAGTTKLGLDINGQYIAKNGSSTVNLKYNSANFGPNTFAGWSIVGAEIVGADVNAVWKDAANNFWYSNNSGTVDKAVTAAEVATYEAAFKQDFNNDGFFGPVVETAGTTKLGLDINGQYIAKNGSSTVNLKYNSANFGPNTFAGWSVVGGEIVGGDVNAVWKDAANNFWYSNNSGTVDKAVPLAAVQQYESAFQQDFDNDGFITIIGTAGADTLVGSSANDRFIGGAGVDTFVLKATNGGVDKIVDFAPSEFLDISDFGIAGFSAANLRTVTGAGVPTGTNVNQFILNSDNGALYFDADGPGSGVAKQIVTLEGVTSLTTANFKL